MTNELISPLSGLRRLIETDQVGELENEFLNDKAPVWSPHNCTSSKPFGQRAA